MTYTALTAHDTAVAVTLLQRAGEFLTFMAVSFIRGASNAPLAGRLRIEAVNSWWAVWDEPVTPTMST